MTERTVSRPPLLEVDGLVKRFGGLTATNHCSFTVRQGSITGLIGPNGSGKTTLFNLVTGMLSADSGTVRLDGRRISGLPPHRISLAGISRTFQLTRVFASMTLLENLVIAAHRGTEADNVRKAMGLLAMVGLDAKRDEPAGSLSYGQRRLLEFARAVMPEPRLVMLDEPFSGVNPLLEEAMIAHIRTMNAQGVTFLIIDHEMKLMMALCDPVIVLDQGAVLTEGAPAAVQADERVLAAYFGQEDDEP